MYLSIALICVAFLYPDFSFAAFVDNGDGTVTDSSANLMWQKATFNDGQSMFSVSATSYCKNLVLPATGYTDWRLPTIDELKSLIGNISSFPDTKTDQGYWSSLFTWDPLHAAYVTCYLLGFNDGQTISCTNAEYADPYCPSYIRCVRNAGLPTRIINLSGNIRDSSNNPGIGVTLTFGNNGGTATTDSSGFYTKTVNSGWSGTVTPSKGNYKFTPPSSSYSNLTSDMPAQNYDFVASNKAISVAGGGNYSTNALWNATKLNTDHAYNALVYQGYKPENINYLSADSNLTSPADGFATNAAFRDAILSWASDAGDLLIYMADHGGNGTFRMNENEILLASQLDGWLDTLQQTIPGNVTLVYDACESGSFIGLLIPPTGKKRIIAASASAGENAIFASDGTLSFSWLFWSQIYGGLPFYQTFLNAQNSMSLINPQNSLIEADGDGIPGQKADSEIAATVRIGDQNISADDFPTIESVSPSQTLTDKTSALIYAENVRDSNGIKKVWAVINPPNIAYSPDTPLISLPTAVMYHVGNNRYETLYEGFTAKGIYRIAIFATDNKDFTSIPEQKHITTVTQTQDFSPSVKKGDISGDNQVNLADVISGLQILSGITPSQIRCDYVTSGADVNGDSRVGLQEVIYILQGVAGLR